MQCGNAHCMDKQNKYDAVIVLAIYRLSVLIKSIFICRVPSIWSCSYSHILSLFLYSSIRSINLSKYVRSRAEGLKRVFARNNIITLAPPIFPTVTLVALGLASFPNFWNLSDLSFSSLKCLELKTDKPNIKLFIVLNRGMRHVKACAVHTHIISLPMFIIQYKLLLFR